MSQTPSLKFNLLRQEHYGGQEVQSRNLEPIQFSGVKKIAQFYSVLLSFGLVRVAEWIERRVEQKAARERRTNRPPIKMMVKIGQVGSRWLKTGRDRSRLIDPRSSAALRRRRRECYKKRRCYYWILLDTRRYRVLQERGEHEK